MNDGVRVLRKASYTSDLAWFYFGLFSSAAYTSIISANSHYQTFYYFITMDSTETGGGNIGLLQELCFRRLLVSMRGRLLLSGRSIVRLILALSAVTLY